MLVCGVCEGERSRSVVMGVKMSANGGANGGFGGGALPVKQRMW